MELNLEELLFKGTINGKRTRESWNIISRIKLAEDYINDNSYSFSEEQIKSIGKEIEKRRTDKVLYSSWNSSNSSSIDSLAKKIENFSNGKKVELSNEQIVERTAEKQAEDQKAELNQQSEFNGVYSRLMLLKQKLFVYGNNAENERVMTQMAYALNDVFSELDFKYNSIKEEAKKKLVEIDSFLFNYAKNAGYKYHPVSVGYEMDETFKEIYRKRGQTFVKNYAPIEKRLEKKVSLWQKVKTAAINLFAQKKQIAYQY